MAAEWNGGIAVNSGNASCLLETKLACDMLTDRSMKHNIMLINISTITENKEELEQYILNLIAEMDKTKSTEEEEDSMTSKMKKS